MYQNAVTGLLFLLSQLAYGNRLTTATMDMFV